MKKTLALALVALVLIGCASRADLESANAMIADLQTQVAANHNQLARQGEELISEQAKSKELAEEKAAIAEDLARATTRATSLGNEVEMYRCPDQIENMKYENVADISTRLMVFLTEVGAGSYNDAFRDRIWYNTFSQLHGIFYYGVNDGGETTRWTQYFMVYMEEEAFPNWGTGIFWIDEQCWLDGPNWEGDSSTG